MSSPISFSMPALLGGGGGPAKAYPTEFVEVWTDPCKDQDSCILATFCTGYQYAKNYISTNLTPPGVDPKVTIGMNQPLAIGICCLYSLGMYFTGPLTTGLAGWHNRGKFRAKHNITTGECASPAHDCVLHAFCPCCALTQEWREREYRKDQVTISVPGALGNALSKLPGVSGTAGGQQA